ncbi:MAG TPA: hypothetical protein ENN96_01425 [Candidatus Acetothermia bacterium]|nr:hypothetical protein [Candidatus Acetothermia bacterium]
MAVDYEGDLVFHVSGAIVDTEALFPRSQDPVFLFAPPRVRSFSVRLRHVPPVHTYHEGFDLEIPIGESEDWICLELTLSP